MTPSLIRCLLAVLALKEHCQRVASKDIAQLIGVKRPTVHRSLQSLSERGLIEKERYGDVQLTAEGEALGRRLAERRDDLTLLFADLLGLEHEQCVRAAVALMGELSEESLLHLQKRYLQNKRA